MMQRPDPAVYHAAATPDLCSAWLRLIDDAGVFDAQASSRVVDVVPGLDAASVWSSLAAPVRAWCATALGTVAIDADQCWIRRQHPPIAAPPIAAPPVAGPHPIGLPTSQPQSWHQDGALRFDFLGGDGDAPPADALLHMVTCWIALTPCGDDAPGLELMATPIDRMLTPAELRDAAVDALWLDTPRLRPLLRAGDAVLFAGHVLHRTLVDGAMAQSRTSIELRCFAADQIPARLGGDRFIVVAT